MQAQRGKHLASNCQRFKLRLPWGHLNTMPPILLVIKVPEELGIKFCFHFFFYSKIVSLYSLTFSMHNCYFKVCMPCQNCHSMYNHELMKFYYASKMLILLCKFSIEYFMVGNIYKRRTRAGTLHWCVKGHFCLASCSFHSVLSFDAHRNIVSYT